MAKCGSCGASPSVRLKPTAVRVMANPAASETGQGGGTGHGTDCRTRLLRKLLLTLVKELQNLPIIAVGEKGQEIRFLNAF